MAGSLDAAELIYKKIEKTVQGDDSLIGRIAHSRVLLAWRRHDYPLAGELAEKALPLLPSSEVAHNLMSNTLGYIYYMRGNYIEAEPLFTQAYEALVRLDNYVSASAALGGLTSIATRKGKLRRVAMATPSVTW